MSKKCSLKVRKGDKILSGTSAQLYYVNQRGGWDAFIMGLTAEITSAVAQNILSNMKNPRQY